MEGIGLAHQCADKLSSLKSTLAAGGYPGPTNGKVSDKSKKSIATSRALAEQMVLGGTAPRFSERKLQQLSSRATAYADKDDDTTSAQDVIADEHRFANLHCWCHFICVLRHV